MANDQSSFLEHRRQGKGWYDLFSRGARDWLRHNEKVQDAVRENLPELISGADILGQGGERTVKVPVRFLEHFRFRLADSNERSGAGQGQGKPGDVLARPAQQGPGKGKGGNDEGGYQFVLELKVDDIVEWLWEELKLPNLTMKTGGLREEDYVRETLKRLGTPRYVLGFLSHAFREYARDLPSDLGEEDPRWRIPRAHFDRVRDKWLDRTEVLRRTLNSA